MKNFRDYLKESEEAAENPVTGDVFAVNIREECLVESVVLEHAEDGVVIAADDRMLEIFESYGITLEDVCMECGVSEGDCGCDHKEYADETPTADPGEYGEEGDMAKNELATIVRAARWLTGMLDNDDDMPEWTQKKINKAADYVDTAADYISSQKERGIMEQPEDGSPVARAVLHRIMMQHPGVLATHGPERVMAAVDDLADRVNIGPDDEIGSSDVSGWTRDVIRMLAELPDEPMNVGDALDEQGVAEGLLGDREHRRVMPFVKRIAGEVSDYDRDEFGEELWSLLDQKYGSKFAQSVLADLDIYWDTYTELTGRGLDEASVYKKDQDLSSVSTQELEAFVKKNWGGGIPTYGQGQSVKRAMRELRRRQKSGVSEAEIDDTWMNDQHREFYKRNPHFKRNDRERVEVGRGTQLATRVNPAVKPAQVQKKPATRFGMGEAEYQGRDVPLGKPMRGDVKKFKVFVRDPKTGNVKKVNFGDPNMRIKKSDPARRKSFRARHNCDNPGPRTKARYWSCRAW